MHLTTSFKFVFILELVSTLVLRQIDAFSTTKLGPPCLSVNGIHNHGGIGLLQEGGSSLLMSATVSNDLPAVSSKERFVNSLPHFIGSKMERNIGSSNGIDTIETDFSGMEDDAGTKKEVVESSSERSRKMDRRILTALVPSIINLMVVPLVNSVDTFWVGQMGDALALAGQAAANQAFLVTFFLIAFLPTITAPLVAEAIGSGDSEAATDRVCESLFLSNVFGIIGTALLVVFSESSLKMVLKAGAPAGAYAAPYLRWRGLSMIPALISAVGFAAYRGMLNTVTPLKVSLAANLINVIADPLLIFGVPMLGLKGLGYAGAAIATAGAELFSGLVYLRLLFRRRLARWSRILRPPKMSSIKALLKLGAAMLSRQAILNFSFVSASRCAQTMDPTGISAAAYSIVMQIYSLGIVVQLAVQATAATLVPSAKASGGISEARKVADRIFGWGLLLGTMLGILQVTAGPFVVPLFSTLPEVVEAAKFPAMITGMIHIFDGFVFAGEGCMIGLGAVKELSIITGVGVATMVGCLLSPLGQRVDGIVLSKAIFHFVQAIAMIFYHLRIGPLRRKKDITKKQHE